jgi:hypothetical protein
MAYKITPLEQVERFNKLAEVIEDHADQFDMSWWVQVQGEDYANQFFSIDMLHQLDQYEVDILAPNCKTRACVAGWTATLWAGELSQAEWKAGRHGAAGPGRGDPDLAVRRRGAAPDRRAGGRGPPRAGPLHPGDGRQRRLRRVLVGRG